MNFILNVLSRIDGLTIGIFLTLVIVLSILLRSTINIIQKRNKIKSLINEIEVKNKSKLLFIFDEENYQQHYENKYLEKNIIDIDDNFSFQKWFAECVDNNIKVLDLVINVYGGSVESSDIITSLLQNFDGIINIYIPYFAFSAGTLIALTGTKLYANKYTLLGPTDPQFIEEDEQIATKSMIETFSLMNKKKDPLSEDFLIKYFESIKLHNDNTNIVTQILNKKSYLSDECKTMIVSKLCDGDLPHHKPFQALLLKNFNYPIIEKVPTEIMELYNQICEKN
jgi:hypothetical protein